MITNEIPGKQSVAENFSPGQVLGESLTLKQKLSTTDTGILWLAHDAESDKDISLLFLPGALPGDARVIEELRAQVKLNRQLIHPHVLRTHDFIQEEGWAAISSDAVEAGTLASLLAAKENGAFDPSEIQPWISALCPTLDDAHRAGLLHRDLVPRNVLLTKGGEILIANFGISRIILDALGRAVGRGKIDEHLASMSPQQLDGEYPARWDDIYALGALIYQLLTGKPPFYSGEILPQIRKAIPPPVTARRAELGIKGAPIPETWEKVIAACLDKHTPPRPKSAREVGVKLGGEISMAPLAPLTPPAQPAVRAEAGEPAAPDPATETVKKEQAAAPAVPVEASPKEQSGEKKESVESKESLVEDIVWRKPAQHAQPAPGEAPSFKHLLEQVPGEQKAAKGFPIFKVAVAAACVAAGIWVIFLSTRSNSPQSSASPLASATPASVSPPVTTPAPKSTPQIASAGISKNPGPSPSASAPGNAAELEQARKNVQDLQTALDAKIQARQKAEADSATAKSALAAETAVLDGMKKTADDTENLRKQSEEAETKAAADAAAAADALKAAQKAADEKAAILASATKAKEQVLTRIKDQETAQQNETAKLQALQKFETDKQEAADAAGNEEQQARTQLQEQQELLKQAEAAAAAQQNSTPAPGFTGSAAPSGTAEAFVTISPGTTPSPSAIEAAEKNVVQSIQSHQAAAVVTPQPSAAPAVPVTYVASPDSQIDHTLTNSLGMKFQPVGDVLFCIWLTRVQDFEVFAKETGFKGTSWLDPGFKQEHDHPVVNVTWNDAMAFCKWLTEKERKTGLLAPNQLYRLPTDLEWSKAVGLPEESGRTPDDRDLGIRDVYPWGTQWPPPPGAGNYDGEETDSEVAIKGYNDGYVYTSPVGSFAANKYGLYDMGGNAWEWCMDWYNGAQKQKVLRGASWYNGNLQLSLLSSCRWPAPADKVSDDFGFRCVIATEGGKPKK